MSFTPPEEVWNAIDAQLTSEENMVLKKKRNHTVYFFLSSVPIIISLVLLSVFNFKTQSVFTAFNFPVLNNSVPVVAGKLFFEPAREETIKNAVHSLSADVPVALVNQVNTAEPVIAENSTAEINNAPGITSEENLIVSVPKKSGNLSLLNPVIRKKPVTKIFPAHDIVHAKSDREKRFYVGVGGYATNSWLINNHTKEGFDKYSLVDNKFSFTLNPVIQVGFNPNGKNFFQAEIMPVESVKQRNNYFSGGKYISEETTIRYSRYNLQAGLLINKKQNKHHYYFVPGVYAENMISHQLNTTAEDNLTNPVYYKKNVYGAELSFIADYSIAKNLHLSAGLKASSGINNINKGNSSTPGYLDPTHNFSLSAGLSLKYFIK